MTNYLADLHPFYVNLAAKLPDQDMLMLTEAMAYIIKNAPVEQLATLLKSFIDPIVQQLNVCLQHHSGPDVSTSSKKAQGNGFLYKGFLQRTFVKILGLLNQLNLYFKVVSPKIPGDGAHPCIIVFRDLIPMFDLILQRESSLSESVCKIFKNAIVSYDIHCLPLLPWMMERIVESFKAQKESCYLWIASYVIRRYARANDPALRLALTNFVKTLTSLTFQQLKSTEDIDKHVEGNYLGVQL
jgi:transportin-3